MNRDVREVLSTLLLILFMAIIVPLGWFLVKQLLWGLVFPTGAWLLLNTQPAAVGIVRGLIERNIAAVIAASLVAVTAWLALYKPKLD